METQGMLGLLIVGLTAALGIHLSISRQWCTGQTAFTGIWLLSAVTLVAFPSSWAYLTWGGVSIVLAVHFAFLIGSLFTLRLRPPVAESVTIPRAACIAVTTLYWTTLLVSAVGIGGLLVATGAWQLVFGASAATLRYVELDPTQIPLLPRVLSNFMLVPVALAPAMALVTGARRPRLRYYLLPFLCLLGQSAAFGGRGAVTFGGLLIFWGFATMLSLGYFNKLNSKTLLPIGGLVLAVLAYSQAIFSSREAFSGEQSGFGEYIALPLPAFCEVLAQNQDQPALNFDFAAIAPVRELLRTSGESTAKRVDALVVLIPQPYNVFTYLFEQILAFGYVGVVGIAFGLGVFCRWLESARQTLIIASTRSLLYCYLGMSVFADLAFFYTGWSLALVIVGLGAPAMIAMTSPRRVSHQSSLGIANE